MSGELCVEHLVSRVMSIKIAAAGGKCSEEDVMAVLLDYGWRDRGGIRRKVSASVNFCAGSRNDSGARPIIAEVGDEWRIFLQMDPDETSGGTVTAMRTGIGDGGIALVHNPAGFEAAKTKISAGESPEGPGMPYAFVERETHYSHGLLWDPGKTSASDVRYYDDGSVRWRRRHQGGRLMGRGDSVPFHESYWPTGFLQAEEYGSSNSGRHRDANIGPAYAEYHPNGKKSLQVYAEKAADGMIHIVGSGTWDSAGAERAHSVHEGRTLSDTSIFLSRTDFLDDYFEKKATDLAIAEAAVEASRGGKAPELPAGGLTLSHPSGMRMAIGGGRRRAGL